ncbi:MAG: ThiF family adenylyltransferase [Candidatus Obscuribacterales bacterium]|nr:ThiF family adenylyltransferase [Candidatus Obscuribacterales bacterium]
MAGFQHEQVFRGKEAMAKLAARELHICGAGALGSNLLVNLARSGFHKITIIDKDRVEEQNLGTQVYALEDVGAQKAVLLRNQIFRDLGESINAFAEELSERNIGKLLKNAGLVIDTFDNSKSRRLLSEYCKEKSIDCLHLGVNDSYGEVKWNDRYLVPSDAGLDLCDYPLARNLIMMVVAVGSEALVNFVLTAKKRNFSITLGDLAINEELD